jgi:hypothetical protein
VFIFHNLHYHVSKTTQKKNLANGLSYAVCKIAFQLKYLNVGRPLLAGRVGDNRVYLRKTERCASQQLIFHDANLYSLASLNSTGTGKNWRRAPNAVPAWKCFPQTNSCSAVASTARAKRNDSGIWDLCRLQWLKFAWSRPRWLPDGWPKTPRSSAGLLDLP